MMDGDIRYRRSASVIMLIALIAVLGLGIALLAASFLPFEDVKAKIDSMAQDGVAEDFTAEAFAGVSGKLRVAGIALVLVAAVIVAIRRPLKKWLSSLFDSFGGLWGESKNAWGSALREDGLKHIIAFCVIILIAIAVRLYFINQPIRYDEAHSFMYYSSRPIYLALSNYSSVNNHLFHTLLVHITYSVLGNEEWVLRLPAFFAGLLLVPATYLAARMLYSKNAAIFAAALVGSSSVLVEFSTNARGYSLICLFFMVLLSLGAFLKERGGLAGWCLFTLVSALGFYTIPIMIYPFGITCVWLLLSALVGDTEAAPRPFIRNLVLSSIVAAVLTLILYSPVFVGSGFQSVFGIPALAAQASGGWEGFAGGIMIRVKGFWAQWNRDFPVVVSAILVLGCALSLIFHRRLARHRVPLVVPVLLWCVPVLIAMRALPWPRVWLYLLPLYIILVSAGLSLKFGYLAALLHRRASTFCLIMALHIIIGIGIKVVYSRSVYYSEETGTLKNAEEIATTLGRELQPGDKMLAYSPAGAPLLYYFKKHGIPQGPLVSKDRDSWNTVYVVVDIPAHSLEWVLAKTKLEVSAFDGPRLLHRYEFAEIYVFERR